MFQDLKLAKRQNYELIYNREGLATKSGPTVAGMFDDLYERLLSDLLAGNEDSAIFRHHIDYLAQKSFSLNREDYVNGTEPNKVVVDYIA